MVVYFPKRKNHISSWYFIIFKPQSLRIHELVASQKKYTILNYAVKTILLIPIIILSQNELRRPNIYFVFMHVRKLHQNIQKRSLWERENYHMNGDYTNIFAVIRRIYDKLKQDFYNANCAWCNSRRCC